MTKITLPHWLSHLGFLPFTYVALHIFDRFPKLGGTLLILAACYLVLFFHCAQHLHTGARLPGSAIDVLEYLGLAIFLLLTVWVTLLCSDLYQAVPDTAATWKGVCLTLLLCAHLGCLKEVCEEHAAEVAHIESKDIAGHFEAHDDTVASGECIACLNNHPNVSWLDCQHVIYCMTCYQQVVKHGGDGKCPFCRKSAKVKRLLFP